MPRCMSPEPLAAQGNQGARVAGVGDQYINGPALHGAVQDPPVGEADYVRNASRHHIDAVSRETVGHVSLLTAVDRPQEICRVVSKIHYCILVTRTTNKEDRTDDSSDATRRMGRDGDGPGSH